MTNAAKQLATRLYLQLMTSDAFIGERDKAAEGLVSELTRQGKCGRLRIETRFGKESCVWRLANNVIDHILSLWSNLTLTGFSGLRFSDIVLDWIASATDRNPLRSTHAIPTLNYGVQLIEWQMI